MNTRLVSARILAGFSLCFLLVSSPVLAKSKVKKEIYPAIVEDSRSGHFNRQISKSGYVDRGYDSSPQDLKQQSQAGAAAQQAAVPAPPITVSTQPIQTATSAQSKGYSTSLSFDYVPEDHMESIAARLKIVEQLIVVHGRAYDYRVHTTAQLMAILRTLDEQKNQSNTESN